MITEAILDWLASSISWVLGLLPEWGGPSTTDAGGAIAKVFQTSGWLNQYFPLDLMLSLMLAMVAWFIGMWAFRLVVWVLTKLHIAGGSDT